MWIIKCTGQTLKRMFADWGHYLPGTITSRFQLFISDLSPQPNNKDWGAIIYSQAFQNDVFLLRWGISPGHHRYLYHIRRKFSTNIAHPQETINLARAAFILQAFGLFTWFFGPLLSSVNRRSEARGTSVHAWCGLSFASSTPPHQ